jgi:hypothetical protein
VWRLDSRLIEHEGSMMALPQNALLLAQQPVLTKNEETDFQNKRKNKDCFYITICFA